MKWMRKMLLPLLLSVFLVAGPLLGGCTTPNPVQILSTPGVPAYAPTDPSTVMVLRVEPQRPHITLGQIVVEPQKALSVPDIEQKLQQAGASMGANAVVILSDMSNLAGPFAVDASGSQVISAIAIRFTD